MQSSTFKNYNELNNHLKTHIEEEAYKCELCGHFFQDKISITDHALEHVLHKSSRCDTSKVRSDSRTRMKNHEKQPESLEFQCKLCEKIYPSMKELRRHDWRSHRAVNCNICDEKIESRQDIGDHRKTKHQLSKKIYCRFYPECLDGDECFFVHEQIKRPISRGPMCPKGQFCSDQSCEYSEGNHKNPNHTMCKFQAQCTRKLCPFQHSVERVAFLAEASSMKNQR